MTKQPDSVKETAEVGVRMLRELADELENESKQIKAAVAELFHCLAAQYPKHPSQALVDAVKKIEDMFGVKFQVRKEQPT